MSRKCGNSKCNRSHRSEDDMKPKEELDKMSKPELIDYLLEVSNDKKEACIVREMAKLKAIQLVANQKKQ